MSGRKCVFILFALYWFIVRHCCHESSDLVCPVISTASGKLNKGDLAKTPVCTQTDCTSNCTCVWANCSQMCSDQKVCPMIECHASGWCQQRGHTGAKAPRLHCNATYECMQAMNYSAADFIVASADSVIQVYKNQAHRLANMTCSSTKGGFGTCNQSCDICGSTVCNADNCYIDCTDCGTTSCTGSQSCAHTCHKECNQTYCNARQCKMICRPESKCSDVRCIDADLCSLDCREGAICSLNCSTAKTCEHSCALNGLCHTWVGEFHDVHDGQCQKCNCTQNVRHCVQRCETKTGRCLEMSCNASSLCEQFSSSTGRSFVHLMSSTAPTIRQTCDNKSDCWQMTCYGSNCTLICDNKATCGYMVCKGNSCTFICKNGASCDVMTCLPGSGHCTYDCDARSTCRHKRCQGEHCVGAEPYVAAKACHIKTKWSTVMLLILSSFYLF